MKFKISIVDANEHLYVIKLDSKNLEEAVKSIAESKEYVNVGPNKYLNPKHIVTIKGDKENA